MKRALLALCLISFSALASEGVTVRGGGDELALEFTQAFQDALAEIRENHPGLESQISGFGLHDLSAQTTLYVVDEPLFVRAGSGEQESVAVNEPDSRTIWLHRQRWQEITDTRLRQAIALHEFLSLEGAESTGRYPISSAYLAKFRKGIGAEVIRSGRTEQDPLQWNRRRITCEYETETRADGAAESEKFRHRNVMAKVDWRVAGREYGMKFFLSSEGEYHPRSGIVMDKQIIEQSIRSIEWENEGGMLFQHNRCSIEVDLMVFGVTGSSVCTYDPELVFEEYVSDRRSRIWSWDRGYKRYPLSQKTVSRLPDGSLHTVEEALVFERWSGFEQLAGVLTCDEQNMPDDTWISFAESQRIGPAVEKLNKLAIVANKAEADFRGCDPLSCMQKERAASKALGDFEAVWAEIYREAHERASEDPANQSAVSKRIREQKKKSQGL